MRKLVLCGWAQAWLPFLEVLKSKEGPAGGLLKRLGNCSGGFLALFPEEITVLSMLSALHLVAQKPCCQAGT